MSRYFDYFPTIKYDNQTVVDVTKRTNFVKSNLSNPFVFLPYTINDGEKPEDVAYYYYGSVDYTWAVLLANELIDPYFSWPISETNFEEFLISKYQATTGLSGTDVLRWVYSENIFSNVVYYYKLINGRQIKINKDSLNVEYLFTENRQFILTEDDRRLFTSADVPEGFIPYRVAQFEQDNNENKRQILLIEKSYISVAEKDLKRLMRQ